MRSLPLLMTLSLLPIGAYAPRGFMRPAHMTAAEAVHAHRDLGTVRSIAIHHGTFRLADEAYAAPRRALAAACFPAPVNGEHFRLPPGGDCPAGAEGGGAGGTGH